MTGWLARLLSGTSGVQGSVIESSWHWRPAWPLWVVIPLAILVLAGACGLVVHETRRRGWLVSGGLCAARVLIVLLLLMMLMQPVVVGVIQTRQCPTIGFLVDGSRSMDLRVRADPSTAVTRRQAAVAALVEPATGLIAAVSGPWEVATGIFAEQLAMVESVVTQPPVGNGTNLAGALRSAREVLRDKPLAALVLLSDGQPTVGGNPLEEARRLREAGVFVHTVGVGEEYVRNLRVLPVLAQRYVFKGDPVPFEVRLSASQLGGEQVPVSLLANGKVVARADAAFSSALDEQSVSLEFTADEPGRVECRFETPVLPGETLVEDNAQSHVLEVLDKPMRVLYVEGEPRWEYRYLQVALSRDRRVQLETLLLVADPRGLASGPGYRHEFPASDDELRTFDLVILGDVPGGYLDDRALERLRDFVVEDGGGVLFLAGERHLVPYEDSPAEMLLPVRIDRHRAQTRAAGNAATTAYRPQRTAWGNRHPILALFPLAQAGRDPWDDLPAMWWSAPVAGLRAGATVLLTHPTLRNREGPEPLCVFHHVGKGRALFVGFDETWRWRSRHGNRFFYRFWGQAVQYLAMPHLLGKKDLVQFEVPVSSSAGESFDVLARVMDPAGTPATEESFRLTAEREDGLVVAATLHPTGDQPGLYRTPLTLPEGGRYILRLESRPQDGNEEIIVHDTPMELRNPNANPNLLRRIAALGGGQYVPLDQCHSLLSSLRAPERVEQRTIERSLWNRPWLLLLAVLILAGEWTARRLVRLL